MTKLYQRAGLAVITAAVLTIASTFTGLALAGPLPTEKECRALENTDTATKGWCAAITRRKGNCLGCHVIVTADWPATLPPGGNVAPPIVSMKQRYPDKAVLRAQIWDATVANPHSVMPPFGKHQLLSEEDIDYIVEFLLTI